MTIDEVMYPYYGHLSAKQKNVYEAIYNAVSGLNRNCAIREKITPKEAYEAYQALRNDRPEIFWISSAFNYNVIGGYVANIKPEYSFDIKEIAARQVKLKQAVQHYLYEAQGSDIIEKERIIHDKMSKNISYVSSVNDQTAYGALVEGKAVCAGYTRGFQLIMQHIGIPCYYVSGYAYDKDKGSWENHAWNIIKLDNDFYNMDITWDDCYDGVSDVISYTYYNCTDSSIAATHKRKPESAFLPGCDGTKYSFENVSGVCPELEIIYQEKVTDRKVVRNQQDFIEMVTPMLHRTYKGTRRMSFPVYGKNVIANAMQWIEKEMYQHSPYKGSWRAYSSYIDYQNGWYKLEVTTIFS